MEIVDFVCSACLKAGGLLDICHPLCYHGINIHFRRPSQ